jgi:hypothetical protein
LAHAAKGVNNILWLTGQKVCGKVLAMETPHDIVNAIGRDRIAKALGVTKPAIVMALGRGALPASWFDYCESQLGPLPRHLFSFKGMCYEK